MMTLNGSACARGKKPMSKDDVVQTSDLLRPRHVGMPIRRTEDPRLLTGNGEYTADRKPDRALHVAFRRSEQPHATILRIDTTQALTAPGVVAVFTADDVAEDHKPVIPFSRMPNYYATPITALASKKVRYVGEAVVAVIAEDRYLAEDALELIDIEYAPLGAVTDPEYAASEHAPLLHEEAATNVLIAREFKKGDAAADLAAAHVRVRDRFEMTRKAGLAIEPRSYCAEFESRRDSITLYTSSNIPGIVRDALAESLDLPGSRLRVVAPDVGGSFGSKGSLYPEEILLCVAAKKLRRSLKWTADRLEDISSSSQAFAEIVDAEMGFDENGIAIALEADVIGDVGAYSIYPWTCGLEPVQVVSFLPGPYKIRSYRGAVRGVATNKPPTGPYRGVGRPISTFVTERLMDMGARALGIDPLEIRRRNLVREDEFPYRIASGIIWDKAGFVECLEAAVQAGEYEKLRGQQRAARAQGRYFGIGLATYAELTGIGSRIAVAPGMPINTGSETAKIRIDSTGAITAAFGVASHGQGLETTLAQIIADDLGARFDDIRVVQGDSDAVPMSTGTYASRSAVLGGGAAKHASLILREKIKKVASHLLEAAADDIDVAGGRATVTGTDRAVTFRQIAKAVYSDMRTLPVEARQELEASYTYDPINGTTACATHLAAVEVDPTTCFVKIHKYVVAEDCGRIINPMIVDGQVHGGVAQGIGAALYEEVIYDEDGQLVSASLADYVIPSAVEIPHMDVVHIESCSAVAGGFRGMGEGGTIGAPAAIANAISDALSPLDIQVSILPITPERIFGLLEQARTKAKGSRQ
jgi:aerobic carbon-monoxide dehydrogenase large subunit